MNTFGTQEGRLSKNNGTMSLDPQLKDHLFENYTPEQIRRNAREYDKQSDKALNIHRFLRKMATELYHLASEKEEMLAERDENP